MPGSRAHATARVDDANNGACALANAAPRANAMSGSSGTLTASAVAASRVGLIIATFTPEPTTKTPSGSDSSRSMPPTSAPSSVRASSSSPGSAR
ncbi:hypothetical protein C1Y40_05856 [Mycobacterium talmoniae]|uniref:Uncharacterized protein n=1 Tax=Mycobacterium talmoniae TaxID=1858794 RepID=A0A2S8BBF7_9MYCO|nr:hypothetical protein C1Y40_05856 [Mycobacterium talmoniae]